MLNSKTINAAPPHALLAVLLLGFLGGIQTTDPIISSVALIHASKALHFSAETTALASGISTLALAATVIASGLLADKFGRRLILILALIVTIAGDVIVATSTNAPMYLTGRTIAGIGLGGVFGASFAYIREVAGNHIGVALGQFGAMGGITTMIAGLLGGILVTTDWRIAYLLVPFLSLIGLLFIPFVLPKVPRIPSNTIDFPGIILIAVGVIGILYGISQASSSLQSVSTLLPIAIGFVALGMFYFVERRSNNPVFPVQLLKNPTFIAAAFTVLVWNFSQAITVLQLSNLWQYVQKYTPTMVSIGQLPMSIVAIISSIVVGKVLASGKSTQFCILLGLLSLSVGFVSLVILPLGTLYWVYLPSLLLIGFGLPFVIVPSGQLFMSEAPSKFFGPVTSSKTTVGQFGYALGLAGSMVLINLLTKENITQKLIKAGVPPSQTGQGLDAVSIYVDTGVHASTRVGQEALQFAASSYTHAFSIAMLIAAIITLTTGTIVYSVLRKRPTTT